MGARPNIILCGGELKRGGGKEKGEREVCLPPKKVLRFYTMKVPLVPISLYVSNHFSLGPSQTSNVGRCQGVQLRQR